MRNPCFSCGVLILDRVGFPTYFIHSFQGVLSALENTFQIPALFKELKGLHEP